MRPTVSILLAMAALSALAAPGIAETSSDWGPGRFNDWGWGHMAFGGATMLLVWGGVILVIVLLVRGLGGFRTSGEPAGPARQTALEVLQERYARGEIDKQEYEERRGTLTAR
jgi:putative membrane protein